MLCFFIILIGGNMYTKNNSVILEVTADKFELCVGLYENTKELSKIKNRSPEALRVAMTHKQKSKDNTYFVRVYIGDKNNDDNL